MGTAIVSTSRGVMTGHEAAPRASAARSWRRSGDDVAHRQGSRSPCPAASTVTIEPELVRVNGPRASSRSASRATSPSRRTAISCVVTRPTDRGEHRALHGLVRTLVANMVVGVTDGYEKRLEIQGVGYRAQLRGRDLELALGYSHPVNVWRPTGIEFEVPQPTRVVVRGNSKQQVGETAANIRKQRPPEPYKGKGIRYEGEVVARKVGKRA